MLKKPIEKSIPSAGQGACLQNALIEMLSKKKNVMNVPLRAKFWLQTHHGRKHVKVEMLRS